MKSLMYKEFHLVISPMFYLVLLFGALLLIPQWVYLVAPSYFLFITVPNLFAIAKAQNDIGFSAMLPVRRNDIVKSRILSLITLEVLQILVTAIFAVVNLAIYPEENFVLDTNATFIGCVFIEYAIYNAVFFPMFYKTAYKIGVPILAACSAALLFAVGVEFLIAFVPGLKVLDGREHIAAQLSVLVGGIIIFVLLNILAYKKSAKNFERVNL